MSSNIHRIVVPVWIEKSVLHSKTKPCFKKTSQNRKSNLVKQNILIFKRNMYNLINSSQVKDTIGRLFFCYFSTLDNLTRSRNIRLIS